MTNGEFALRYPLFLRWWHYADKRPELYGTISGMKRVLVTARVSPTNSVTWAQGEMVFHEKIVVFPAFRSAWFAIMQSSFHWEWARMYTSTLGAITLNYAPSDCFETFPFPPQTSSLDDISDRYYAHRQSIMLVYQEGLTSTYNRFHDPSEKTADLRKLRELHVEMDQAVAAAYGWTDLALRHDFHPTKQGVRFTIGESVRREILDRLLRLNHERYAQEVAQGMHDKIKKQPKSRAKAVSTDSPLLEFEEQEA